MVRRSIKIVFSGLLVCISLSLPAQSSAPYYDLNEGIVRHIPTADSKHVAFTRNIFMASEDFKFSPQFLEQTQKMMEREAVFRHKCNIAEGTNIAQLCIYASYRGSPDMKCVEIFDPRSCKGRFYLSGNSPVSFAQDKGSSSSFSKDVDIQKVSHEKGYMEVRQRAQPLLMTIMSTLNCLEKVNQYIENLAPETQELGRLALAKRKEVEEFLTKRDQIIGDLKQRAKELDIHARDSGAITQIADRLMIGMLGELAACLEDDDFYFVKMNNTRENRNIKDFIDSIQKELASRHIGEVLNSKHFNLGCSEPLLLYDLFGLTMSREDLMRTMKKEFINEQLETITIQLHSTKTPCKSCLVSCCGHLQEGLVRGFLERLHAEIKSFLKREDIGFRFLISYHAPYEDNYPFQVPVVSTGVSLPENALLIVNMQFYDKRYQEMKARILKEERLRLQHLLLTTIQEGKGISADEIRALLQ